MLLSKKLVVSSDLPLLGNRNAGEVAAMGSWPLARSRRRWKRNIKMDTRDVGSGDGGR